MADQYNELDQFLAGKGILGQMARKKAADKRAKAGAGKVKDTAMGRLSSDNPKVDTRLGAARQASYNAAFSLSSALREFKAGTLSKDKLNKVYQQYSAAQDKLFTMDAPLTGDIHKQFFPDIKTATSTSGTDQYGNVGGVAPAIVFGPDGQPLKNPDGTYKTSTSGYTSGPAPTSTTKPKTTVPPVVPTPTPTPTGTGTGTKTATPVKPGQVTTPPKKTTGVDSTWSADYGGIGAMALTIPWMKSIFGQAIAGHWTADKFTQQIKNYTDPTTGKRPWDSIIEGYRASAVAYYGDKQAWAEQYNDKLNLLQISAIRQGEDPSAFGQKIDVSNVAAIDAAFKDQHNPVNTFFSTYYGNMPPQLILDQYVSNHTSLAKTDKGVYAGQISANIDALKSFANDMGVASMYLPSKPGSTGDYYANAAKNIQDGTTTLEEQQNYLKEQAISIYSPWANRIKEGMTVRALANPYLAAAGNLLEVDPSSIDLGSSTGLGADITNSLRGDGTTPQSLDAFMTQIKQRPEWLQTTNARNSIMDTATNLLRNFGMVTGG